MRTISLQYSKQQSVVTRAFLQELEAYLGVPFTMISTGPEREKLIIR